MGINNPSTGVLTQTVSGTITANQGSAGESPWPVIISGDTITITVSGSISVSNLPITQTVSGTVSVSNFPTTQTVSVSNFPTTQTVSGSISVSNLPTTQTVSGTISVSNFPATQTISGTISVSNLPTTQTISGTISISNLPTTQTISGTISISNLPTTQTVSGTVSAQQQASTTGGWSNYFANAIKGTVTISSAAGKFAGCALINTDSAPVYLQVFDTTGTVTLGSTTPTFVIPYLSNSTAANGAADRLWNDVGGTIANGLKCAATTTQSNSTTSTNGLTGTIWYK